MGLEIERKWLAGSIPDNIAQYPHTDIAQGYLCTDPVVRVRKDGDSYYLTYKGKGNICREEYNLPLTSDAYNTLIGKCDGIVIDKTRYRIPIDGDLTAELDIFHGTYEGLIYIEVEFDSKEKAEAFVAPDWFGREVTGISGYSNAELAKGIAPHNDFEM